jgi:chromosome segregation ATPase
MHNRVQAVLLVLLVLSLGLSGWLYLSQQRSGPALQARVSELEKSNQAASDKAAALAKENETLRTQLAERGIEPAATAPAHKSEGDGRRLDAIRELALTQTKLANATASNNDLQNRIRDLESARENLALENKKLAASESGIRDDFESTRRVVQAMEAELKTKNERLAQLETNLRRSRDELAALQKKSGTSGDTANSLLEVNRRRETVVNSLQRRYRELTDQLRALAVRLDTQRDSPVMAAPDISRIQTTVQSAEDDLRQLLSLNTQAQSLTQKLGQK